MSVVVIRWHELSLEWLSAVARLLASVEDADPALIPGDVQEAAQELRETIWRCATEAA